MSEVMENLSEQNSAQSKQAAAPPTETVEDVTVNNVEAAVKAVPEAVTESSAAIENADDSGSNEAAEKSSPKVANKKTPVKRTPSKRMSFIERAQKESEALVKNMGGSLEIEGGRKTRSSTRGTPTRSAVTSTSPPAKKGRASPASGSSTPTRPRGRGRKIDVTDDGAEEEENKATPSKKKTPSKGKKAAAKEVDEDEEEVVEKPEEVKEVEKKSQENVDTKSNLVADEPNQAPASSEATKKTADAAENPEEDKTDASLETVVEETQSQVAADVLPTEKNVTKEPENKSAPAKIVSELSESAKSGSPIQTEDVKMTENATKKNTKAADGVKEPTPEPMEIDSSPSMDDDVVELEDVVELSDESEVVEVSTKIVGNQQPTAEHTKKINIENVEKNIKENSVAPNVDIVANNSIKKTATDAANANEIKTTALAANDSSKSENNLCEPKIATSPPISAAKENSTATTPQSCN